MTPNQNSGQPRMRGHSDLFHEQMKSYREGGDRQFESWKQAKAQINARLQQIDQRRQTLVAALQKRVQSIGNPETARQFQAILDQLQQQYAQGWNEMVRQANAGITSIQEAHTGFQLPSSEVFVTALTAERQAVEQLNGIVDVYWERAKGKQGELRQTNEGIRKETDQMLANYDVLLDKVYGDKAIRQAKQQVAAAKSALQAAKVNAADQGLPQLKKNRNKLDRERTTKQTALDAKKRALDTAKAKVQTETEAKAKLDALPVEIQKLEDDLKPVKDAADAAQLAVDQKRTEAVANNVDVAYLDPTKKVDDILIVRNQAADAEKAAVVGGPVLRAQEIAKIDAKLNKDIPLIRAFYEAKAELDGAKRKVTAAQKALTDALKKVTDEETALRIAPVPAKPWRERIAAATEARQKLLDKAQAKVTPLEDAVLPLEQEMDEKYTTPLQELDDQIQSLQDPVTQAQEAVRTAEQRVTNLRGVVVTPASPEQQKDFLGQSRTLLTQINKEGKYMRDHFSGEQAVESRTIDLVKRRTDVAAEIAERSTEEKDVRAALNYAKEEYRWLNKQADQHADRIAELLPIVRSLSQKYCEMLQQKTEASIGKSLDERWQPIQQELMALQEYQPVTGKARIEALKQRADQLVDERHAPLKLVTNTAIIECDGGSVTEDLLRHTLSAINREGVFLKKFGDRSNRFAYLREQHAKFTQQLAEKRGEQLRGEATRVANTGTMGGKRSIDTIRDLIDTERGMGEGTNARSRQDVETLKQAQLEPLAQETDRVLIPAINNPDRSAKMRALTTLLEEVQVLFTHFLDRSADRIAQLRAVAETLLKQIAEQSDTAAERATADGATDRHFREGYSLLAQERSFLTNNSALVRLVPNRLATLQSTENALDKRLIDKAQAAEQRALETKTVADLDAADQFLRLMGERVPFIAPEQRVIITAAVEKAQRALGAVRAQSAEREGLKRAGVEVDVESKIDEIHQRLQRVQIESPSTWEETNQREQMVAQLKKDAQVLQENLPRASNAQRIRMEFLITQIADATWEKLNTQEEKEKIYKKNFSLMLGEAKTKLAEMRNPLASPTLEQYDAIIRAGQVVHGKAQGYVDVAATYRMDRKQVEALRDLMTELTAEITRTQQVVATFKRSAPRS